jgi:hypothetical protein
MSVCYQQDALQALNFDPPWAQKDSRNWYMNAPSPQMWPRPAASLMSMCGKVQGNINGTQNFSNNIGGGCGTVGRIPYSQPLPTTCGAGRNHAYNQSHFRNGIPCDTNNPCPTFSKCDFRFGTAGFCAEPRWTGQLN